MKRLDELSRDGKEARANLSARPSMAYETFSGDISQFPTLQNIQQELFERFADKNAADGGAARQLFQLSKIFIPDLASTVMSLSGAERGAQKAVAWFNVKFNSP